MAAVNLRQMSVEIDAYMLQKIDQPVLSLLERTLTDCEKIEPLGVGDLLRSSLSDEIDFVKIGIVLTGYMSLGQT